VSQTQRNRVHADVVALCHKGLDLSAFFEAARQVLERSVDFDGCCWLTLDPATYLPTSHVAHNSIKPEDVPRLAENEILETDVNKLAELARAPIPSGILNEATSGKPETSPRFRNVLLPNDLGPELRTSFVDAQGAWGGMAMYRKLGRPDFTAAEKDLLAGLSQPLAEGVRRAIVMAAARATETDEGPGLILLEQDGSVQDVNPAADRLLQKLISPPSAPGRLPNIIHAVAYRALLSARGDSGGLAMARVPTEGGNWMVLHGSVVGSAEAGRTAVIIEPARSAEMAPLIAAAYGLSGREGEITRLLLQGASTNEVAASLHLSAYTVQDHLKSIFDKVGVRSRGELVAEIFFHHYAPRLTSGSPLGPSGWFADQPESGPDT